MAEGGSSGINQSNMFYCHKCYIEIEPKLPDYTCPRCQNGFIEPISAMSSSSSSSSSDTATSGRPAGFLQDDLVDMDSDNSSSLDSMDDSANLFGLSPLSDVFFPRNSHSYFVDSSDEFLPGGAAGSSSSSNSNSSTTNTTEGENSSGGPSSNSRRRNTRRVINALLMGPTNRRSRLQGPERTQTLGPMLQDLIVHISTGAGPMGLFHEELASNPGDYAWGRGGLDAVVTHLLNQMEGNGPPPLSQEQITDIPIVSVTQQQIKSKIQCSVCMEDFSLEEKVKQLPCEHCFHEHCITPWLKMHATCPVCRKSLNDGPSAAAPSGPPSAAPAPSSSRQRFNLSSSGANDGSNQTFDGSFNRVVVGPTSRGGTTTLILSSSPAGASSANQQQQSSSTGGPHSDTGYAEDPLD